MSHFSTTAYLSSKGTNIPKIVSTLSASCRERYEIREKGALNALKSISSYAHDKIEYYRDARYSCLGNINSINDLNELPIITKQELRNAGRSVLGKISHARRATTGGSTGEPLAYYMSNTDYQLGRAISFRGWGYAGYRLGDRVAILAGASLMPSHLGDVKARFNDYLQGFLHLSSYGMGERDLESYIKQIDDFRPRYLRGYATSLNLLSRYLLETGKSLKAPIMAVFSTSEMLLPEYRKNIQNALGVKVYNQYGLNDGGISAFECKCGKMHIDCERAILECVDDSGLRVLGKTGRILATSLFNDAMPFFRYNTGDLGVVEFDECDCGVTGFVLKSLEGRETDFLEINDKKIGSPVLTVLMGKHDIIRYSIMQTDTLLSIFLIPGMNFTQNDEKEINESLNWHVGPVETKFVVVGTDFFNGMNKHKFIIKNI